MENVTLSVAVCCNLEYLDPKHATESIACD